MPRKNSNKTKPKPKSKPKRVRPKKNKEEKRAGQHNKQLVHINVSSSGSGGGGTGGTPQFIPQFIPTNYNPPIQQHIVEPTKGNLAEVVKPIVKEVKPNTRTVWTQMSPTPTINSSMEAESDTSLPFYSSELKSNYKSLSSIKPRSPPFPMNNSSYSTPFSKAGSGTVNMENIFHQNASAQINPHFAEAEAVNIPIAAAGGGELPKKNRGRQVTAKVALTAEEDRAKRDLENKKNRDKRAARTVAEIDEDNKKRREYEEKRKQKNNKND
jgi:hypothetical protein